jgi:hypothetical protein
MVVSWGARRTEDGLREAGQGVVLPESAAREKFTPAVALTPLLIGCGAELGSRWSGAGLVEETVEAGG